MMPAERSVWLDTRDGSRWTVDRVDERSIRLVSPGQRWVISLGLWPMPWLVAA